MSDTPDDPDRRDDTRIESGTPGRGDAARTDPDDRVRSDSPPQERRSDTDSEGPTHAERDTLKWLSGVVSLIGLWIAVSPFVYDTTRTALWNNVVVGAAIFLLAGYGFYRLTEGYRPDVGSSSLVALLGLWAVAAPFLLAFQSDGLIWSTMASGVAVAILSGYNAYEIRRAEATQTAGTRV